MTNFDPKCLIFIPTQLKRSDIFEKVEKLLSLPHEFEILLSINSFDIKQDCDLPHSLKALLKNDRLKTRYCYHENGESHVSELFNISYLEFTVYLADDDDIYQDGIKKTLNFLQKDINAPYAFGGTTFSINGKKIKKQKHSRNDKVEQTYVSGVTLLKEWPEQCSVVYRTSYLKQIHVPQIYSLDLYCILALERLSKPIQVNAIVGNRNISWDSISHNRKPKEFLAELQNFFGIYCNNATAESNLLFSSLVELYISESKKLAYINLCNNILNLRNDIRLYQLNPVISILVCLLKNLYLFERIFRLKTALKLSLFK